MAASCFKQKTLQSGHVKRFLHGVTGIQEFIAQIVFQRDGLVEVGGRAAADRLRQLREAGIEFVR